jgi:hypothetical protein
VVVFAVDTGPAVEVVRAVRVALAPATALALVPLAVGLEEVGVPESSSSMKPQATMDDKTSPAMPSLPRPKIN